MSPTHVNYGSNQSGMTLLELLISLTLTLLIASSLYAGLHIAGRAWNSGNQIAEKTTDRLLVRDWLRRQLGRMPLIISEPSPGKKQMEFAGERDIIRFIGEIPAHLGGGGLNEMQLLVSEDRQLMLQYRPYPETIRDQDRRYKQRALLDKVELISFSYFGNVDPELSSSWADHWSGTEYLPQMISIQIQRQQDEKDWPALLIPVMVDGNSERRSQMLISLGNSF
jgi:general secretion pathway protein J